MREIYKSLYEIFTDSLVLPVNKEVWSLIIAAVLDSIAFRKGWNAVRDLYRSGFISGRNAGSLLHWLIRGITFFVLWAGVYAVLVVGQFVVQYWQHILCVLLLILAAIVLIMRIFRYRMQARSVKQASKKQ